MSGYVKPVDQSPDDNRMIATFQLKHVGLLGVAELQRIANLEVDDDNDLSETADDQRESSGRLKLQDLIESYWNWFFFASNVGALCGYTLVSWLCQVYSGKSCCFVY